MEVRSRSKTLLTLLLCAALLPAMAGCATIRELKKPKTDPYTVKCDVPECAPIGWIWPRGEDGGAVPYVPREGDIILTSSINRKQTLAYLLLAKVGLPHHVMMVVRRSNGQLATFEVGSGGERKVAIRSISTRLNKHKQLFKGSVISIRQIKRPLTPSESHRLTCFAESQLGKPFYSKLEFLPLAIPGRPFPESHHGQETWFCSEIVVHAIRVAGLLKCCESRPKQIVPHDIYHDKRCNFSCLWTNASEWAPRNVFPTVRPKLEPKRVPNPSAAP